MIPELHDVGKLLRCEKHWLEGESKADNWDDDTWLAIRFHGHKKSLNESDKKEFEEIRRLDRKATNYKQEIRRAMFLLSLADGASSSSRVLPEESKREARGFFPSGTSRVCLWRDETPPNLVEKEAHEIPSSNEVKRLLDDALVEPSWENFKKKYENDLKNTPEDKHPLRAVTSLLAHCELVGKIFRLLDSAVEPRSEKLNGKLSLGETDAANMAKARENWSVYITRADVIVPQRVAHAGDVNVFAAIDEILKNICSGAHSDHVLFTASQTLWLILLPGEKDKLKEILKPLCELGVVVSAVKRESKFTSVVFPSGSDLEASKKDESHQFEVLSEYPEVIDGPLCEVCQIRAGEPQNPDPDSGVVEVLCSKCSKIREEGSGFHNLKKWDEGSVLWCRVALDGRALPGHLSRLYRCYLQNLKFDNGSRMIEDNKLEELVKNLQPAALLADYADDYQQFISTFWKKVECALSSLGLDKESSLECITSLENGASDLFAVKLDKEGIPDKILDAFSEALRQWFPVSAKQDDCPVRIGLSVGGAKHPFFLHWENLTELKKTINLFSPARRPVWLNLDGLEEVRKIAGKLGNTYLHKLAEIERRTGSRLMVEVEMIEDRKFDILEAARKVGLENVLSYQMVAGAGGD